jgi:type 1 fimbria pilin
MRKLTILGGLAIVVLMGLLGSAGAADGDADMTFHGTLRAPPPCTINDDNRIDVDFGERVGISKVDGVNYRQPLNYQITCENDGNNNGALTLSLTGTPAGFDVQALQSNKGDMGIRIYQNDVPFTPNSALAIDLSNPPKLEAVPVKRAGSVLTEGTFDSWATLRADYQ